MRIDRILFVVALMVARHYQALVVAPTYTNPFVLERWLYCNWIVVIRKFEPKETLVT